MFQVYLLELELSFNMNQDVSVPTVEKFMEDTSANVSKHEAIVSKNDESNVGNSDRENQALEITK